MARDTASRRRSAIVSASRGGCAEGLLDAPLVADCAMRGIIAGAWSAEPEERLPCGRELPARAVAVKLLDDVLRGAPVLAGLERLVGVVRQRQVLDRLHAGDHRGLREVVGGRLYSVGENVDLVARLADRLALA